jgi:hypothetical protein
MDLRISIVFTSLLCSVCAFGNEREAPSKPAAATTEVIVPGSAVLNQLVGTWDVRYEIFDKDGSVRRYHGQVHYSWILEGKALQEIWTSDSEDSDPRPYGTTINFYDPKRQRWTAVWIYPAQGQTTVVTGGDVNGRYVLTGHDESGALQRWSTGVEGSDSIVGRFDISDDDGKTWRAVGVNHMQRHRG